MKEATEDEMDGWHHRLNGHEFGQTSGDSEGQGSLAWCSTWVTKESRHDLAMEQQTKICSIVFLTGIGQNLEGKDFEKTVVRAGRLLLSAFHP